MSLYDDEGKKVPAGKCAGCGGALQCHNGRCDYFEELDRRYEVRELDAGWQFISPIRRLETIERIEEPSEVTGYRTLVYTTETGPAYCWQLSGFDKIEAVPPRITPAPAPAVLVTEQDWRDGNIVASIADSPYMRVDYGRILIEAHYKRGEGWTIASRLNGRDLAIEKRVSKAQARTLVRQWAKQHAKTLGIPVRQDGA